MVRNFPTATSTSRKTSSKSAFLLALGILFGLLLQLLKLWLNGSVVFGPSSYTSPYVGKISKASPESLFPPHCTAADLAIVEKQLPPWQCESTIAEPWKNECSFSFATRCPDPIWLFKLYSLSESIMPSSTPTAIYVGCNKAMDAVNTLRMLSKNTTYDREVWRTTLIASSKDHEGGRCGQEFAEQFLIPQDSKYVHDAVVHCIEAMPSTAKHLMATAQQLHWSKEHLIISNIAVSDTDGTIYFPNLANKVGIENMGIENCAKPRQRKKHKCVEIPMFRLDTYIGSAAKWMDGKQFVDFLSIDVEGFDFEVLSGASNVLERTKYIEFEYNWKGNWKKHTLASAIEMLKKKDFSCYWSGSFGHIWRITDCWMDYFNLKFWSNVACVNVRLAPKLSSLMENQFQRTLKAGDKIAYSHSQTANTDGGLHEVIE